MQSGVHRRRRPRVGTPMSRHRTTREAWGASGGVAGGPRTASCIPDGGPAASWERGRARGNRRRHGAGRRRAGGPGRDVGAGAGAARRLRRQGRCAAERGRRRRHRARRGRGRARARVRRARRGGAVGARSTICRQAERAGQTRCRPGEVRERPGPPRAGGRRGGSRWTAVAGTAKAAGVLRPTGRGRLRVGCRPARRAAGLPEARAGGPRQRRGAVWSGTRRPAGRPATPAGIRPGPSRPLRGARPSRSEG